jgi:hypothetical protein
LREPETGEKATPDCRGTDRGYRGANVSVPKKKNAVDASEPPVREQKRSKEKLIRLDDLIPKQNVSGGRQLLFGATDINQTKEHRKRS